MEKKPLRILTPPGHYHFRFFYQHWESIIQEYLDALRIYEITGDEEPLSATVRLDQGAAYLPQRLAEADDRDSIEARAEKVDKYHVPEGVRTLVASVDVPLRMRQSVSPMPRPDEAPAGETVKAQAEHEEWEQTIERTHVTGRVHEITEETWFYFLEVLPPKLLRGRWFAFAEGQEPLTIFWRRNGIHYCRRLTEEETDRVCAASGLPRNYGC